MLYVLYSAKSLMLFANIPSFLSQIITYIPGFYFICAKLTNVGHTCMSYTHMRATLKGQERAWERGYFSLYRPASQFSGGMIVLHYIILLYTHTHTKELKEHTVIYSMWRLRTIHANDC